MNERQRSTRTRTSGVKELTWGLAEFSVKGRNVGWCGCVAARKGGGGDRCTGREVMQGAQNVGSPPPRTECATGLVAEDAFERPAAGTGGVRDVVQVAGGVVDDEGGGPDGAIVCRPGQPEGRLGKLVQLVDQYGHERRIEMLCQIEGTTTHDMEQKLSR